MPDYEYRGLMAEAWDLLRGDTSAWPDRAWFRTVIECQHGPALDVGCGTGRLLLDYLARGLDVDGIDASPEMLALCRAKAAAAGLDVAGRLHLGEMQHLALPRRYATIFVPSLSIQLLTDPMDLTCALAAFHAHLVPRGRLALSFSSRAWDDSATAPPDGEWSEWELDAEAVRADGATVRRWCRGRFHPESQLLDETFRYEVVEGGVVVASELLGRIPTIRIYSLDEAVNAVRVAGFSDVSATRESTFVPADPADRRFKILARRA
jgi:SAM-dependent methyltransferase